MTVLGSFLAMVPKNQSTYTINDPNVKELKWADIITPFMYKTELLQKFLTLMMSAIYTVYFMIQHYEMLMILYGT